MLIVLNHRVSFGDQLVPPLLPALCERRWTTSRAESFLTNHSHPRPSTTTVRWIQCDQPRAKFPADMLAFTEHSRSKRPYEQWDEVWSVGLNPLHTGVRVKTLHNPNQHTDGCDSCV